MSVEYVIIRTICAFFSGVIISQTGTFIQLITKNILASPSTLGFDGLSVLWVLVLHSILVWMNIESGLGILLIGLPFFILLGLFYGSIFKKSKSVHKLILMGLTFNLLVGAIFSLWQFLFLAFNLPFPIELWFGHFRFANIQSALLLISVFGFILIGWRFYRKEFILLSFGRSVAGHFKVSVTPLYRFIFISISVGTFVVVSLFGAFSFLGLIFPIISRRIWFHRFDISGEYIYGSIFNGLLFCLIDFVCYSVPVFGAEIPMGLISMIVGALSLLIIIWKSTNRLEILAKA